MTNLHRAGSTIVVPLALTVMGPRVLPGAPLNTSLSWNVPIISEDQVNNNPAADPLGDGSTDSTASGWATVEIKDNPDFIAGLTTDTDQEYLISVAINWDDLQGDLTKVHIHGWLTASGKMVGPHNSTPTHLYEVPGLRTEENVIASGVDRRSDTHTVTDQFLSHTHPFDDSSFFIQPSSIIEEFQAGRAYFNIHSTAHPMGEIRGNLPAIPEPSTWLLSVAGLWCLLVYRRWATE